LDRRLSEQLARESHVGLECSSDSLSAPAKHLTQNAIVHRVPRQIRVFAPVLVVISGLLTSSCGLCANDLLERVRAPDNSVEVVVFQRDCGATTGFSTQASIGEIDAGTGNRAGDIFIATTNNGAAPVGKGGGPELRVRWLDARTIELVHHGKAWISKASTSHGGLTIRYSTFQ
jgi:hypothetical protein